MLFADIQNNNGRCGNPNNGGIAGTNTVDPWVNSYIIDFADQNDDPTDDDGCVHAKTFDEAQAICAADGARLCTQAEIESNCDYGSGCNGDSSFIWTSTECTPAPEHVCSRQTWPGTPGPCRTPDCEVPDYCQFEDEWVWMDRPCELKVQVDAAGFISVIHGGAREGGTGWNIADNDNPKFAVDNGNMFAVTWDHVDDNLVGGSSDYPNPDEDCPGPACQISGKTCLCDTTVSTAAVFLDPSNFPSKDEVLARLHYGAVPPDMHNSSLYTEHESSTPEVGVWTIGSVFDIDTIFVVQLYSGQDVWLSNQLSTVHVGNFSFRNPPVHASFSSPNRAAAEYEVDAMIDHLVYHQNTAPFISTLLIKRLTTSNPSPRYVRTVAEAFRTGRYDGVQYGTYGDLAATFAAILMDREARSTTIDADPSHGKLREPLLKAISLLRSMEYVSAEGRAIDFADMTSAVGQHPYRSPSVFNYYRPDYMPRGLIADHGLHSPEAQLLSPPTLIEYLNGMAGLVHIGLSTCTGVGGTNFGRQSGFGVRRTATYGAAAGSPWPSFEPLRNNCVDSSQSDGVLTFVPTNPYNAAAAVSELDLLLTGGRLNSDNKAYIESVYRHAVAPQGAKMVAYAAGPEYGEVACSSGSELHAVTCCADLPLPRFSQRCFIDYDNAENIWAGSNLRDTGCVELATFAEAEAVCATEEGSRLCTVEELQNGCQGGCGGRHVRYWASDNCTDPVAAAVKKVQRLTIATPEYSVTTESSPASSERQQPAALPYLGRDYKAVVVVYLSGGLDSYNLLVPHSNCQSDMYAEYASIRTNVAMPLSQLLPIDVPTGWQPCDTFAVHYKAPHIKTIYDDRDALFIANIGSLLEPVTAQQYQDKSVEIPPGLFSHSDQTTQAKTVHPQELSAKGVLGRLVDALSTQPSPFRARAYSIWGNDKIIESKLSTATLISPHQGVPQLDDYASLSPDYFRLSGSTSNFFAETFAGMVESALLQTSTMGLLLQSDGVADSRLLGSYADTTLAKQLRQVAKVMTIHADPKVQSERDVFLVQVRTNIASLGQLEPLDIYLTFSRRC